MTNTEWKEVEERLKSPFNVVRLKCDEYELSLVLSRISTYKMAICFYVNGVLKGE